MTTQIRKTGKNSVFISAINYSPLQHLRCFFVIYLSRERQKEPLNCSQQLALKGENERMTPLLSEKYKRVIRRHMSAAEFLYWMSHSAFSSDDMNYLHLLSKICFFFLKIIIKTHLFRKFQVLLNI